jgi:hypothetical protein
VAYYLVPVAGDRPRASELLELNAIQHRPAKDGGLIARLAAPDPEKARVRVLASLGGGDFEVGAPEPEGSTPGG